MLLPPFNFFLYALLVELLLHLFKQSGLIGKRHSVKIVVSGELSNFHGYLADVHFLRLFYDV